jgi:inositol polyphosphate 1-phosphatase
MKVTELLSVLVNSSEKAANIARLGRSNEHLFSLLIEEKTGEEANKRFVQDFKTLADVLIQETIRNDVGKLYPRIKDSVKGEESNKFQNAMGEKIIVEIQDEEQTEKMLLTVLDQNEAAARDLAKEIHRDVVTEESKSISDSIPDDVNQDDVGIWIDPIDGTQEYIAGMEQPTDYPNIKRSGLKCATVLIGAYLKSTGEPFLGVINQPFASEDDGGYKSNIFYGISLNDLKITNVSNAEEATGEKLAIISSSEAFKLNSFRTVAAAGAGYKALKVIQHDADIYYLSKDSTFKWDTCACQAVLRALGGDIVEFTSSVKSKLPIPLKYGEGEEKCNRYGLIAYQNIEDFLKLVEGISY